MGDTPKPDTVEEQIPDHGVHPDAAQEESKGLPHSDREKTETAVARVEA